MDCIGGIVELEKEEKYRKLEKGNKKKTTCACEMQKSKRKVKYEKREHQRDLNSAVGVWHPDH